MSTLLRRFNQLHVYMYIAKLVTHTRTLMKLVCSLWSLGRVTRNAPNLNIMPYLRIWTTSDIANAKPMEIATLHGSLHNVANNQQHKCLYTQYNYIGTLPD